MKTYIKPQALVKEFVTENVIMTSGVTVNTPKTAIVVNGTSYTAKSIGTKSFADLK